MHASSVLFDNEVVAFSGVSGSGKTTLSLLFSQYGHYLGDEYAFLDLTSGHLWHERHPYQLKASNAADMISDLSAPEILPVRGEPFGQAYYASLATTNHIKADNKPARVLKTLVFPHFERSCQRTSVERLPISKLPPFILQSLMGQDSPSALFKRFVQLAANQRIQFLEVCFSNGEDAAEVLYKFVSTKKGALQE